jgi:DNA-binding transcriptional MocR family regulator
MPYRFSERVGGLRSSAIREILRVVNSADVISLAGGLPAAELFPTEHLARLAADLFASPDAAQALQYSETEGHAGLRERIAQRLPFPSSAYSAGDILVTQGSQQGIDLLAKLFLDPGDEVLVESPSYLGALQVFRFFSAKITFVASDEQGMRPDALEEALKRAPKLVYFTPTFQNPTGLCYPAARRTALRAVLAKYDTLVIEDDPYRDLWYDEPPPAPLIDGLDRGKGVYLGSFSKTAVPGLRIGYLMGPDEIVKRCIQVKQATDLQTNSFGQHMLYRFLGEPAFDEHVANLRTVYRERRDAMEEALTATLGNRLTWRRPTGGMFFWSRLTGGFKATDLLPYALKEGVAFVSGAEFHDAGVGLDTLRLNFTHARPERLREGVKRLARGLDAFTKSLV